jgi:hypothetical protein
MAKVAKNRRKVKAMALLFRCFSPIYEKWQKSLKMDEMLSLYSSFFAVFSPFIRNGKSRYKWMKS